MKEYQRKVLAPMDVDVRLRMFIEYVELEQRIDRIEICPMCGHKTTYGEMIWLFGIATCPKCYELRRAMLDADVALIIEEE